MVARAAAAGWADSALAAALEPQAAAKIATKTAKANTKRDDRKYECIEGFLLSRGVRSLPEPPTANTAKPPSVRWMFILDRRHR